MDRSNALCLLNRQLLSLPPCRSTGQDHEHSARVVNTGLSDANGCSRNYAKNKGGFKILGFVYLTF